MYIGMAIVDGVMGRVFAADNLLSCKEAVTKDFIRRVGDLVPEEYDYLFVSYIGPSMQEEQRWVFFTDTQLWTEV